MFRPHAPAGICRAASSPTGLGRAGSGRRWRRAGLYAALAASAVGCESWKSVKVDNPVLAPPPPRLSWQEAPGTAAVMTADASSDAVASSDPAGIVKVGLEAGGPIEGHSVVAMINGETLLAGDLLAPYRALLVQAEGKAPAWQIDQLKRQAIKKDLDRKIEQTLLLQAVRRSFKAEQIKGIEKQLDEAFEEQVRKIMASKGVATKAELEEILKQQGMTLAEFSQAFKTNQLSIMYLTEKAKGRVPIIGRQDVVDYYIAHQAEFETAARVRFQLLKVSFKENGGKEGAQQKLVAADAEQKAGVAFPDVCKKFSDGPNADRGGQWDWIKPGEFNDEKVDKALFSLPIGTVSPVFQTPSAYVVVKVTDREEAGRASLADVQDRIRDTLEAQARKAAAEGLLAELKREAVIEIFVE